MTEKILDKTYDPRRVEEKWLQYWMDLNLFHADENSKKPVFSMVIPPPNITGSLHLGHALNNTLQDIMARYKRMKGYNVMWLPGIDHAGIATQNVVERELKKEGIGRDSLGRDAFIERVWQWKEKSAKKIIEQLKKLGASCDWTRLSFTMDEGASRAVREAFVRLYNEGLIYRDDYIINFCPRCHTALSDLEVDHEQKDSTLYYIDYPIKDFSGKITVATTRPETMLGDVAVAVNPQDERYKAHVGKTLALPLTERNIPLIADKAVEKDFGTGCVKITPGHDFNDFEIAKRHDLKPLVIMDTSAHMNENAGVYKGLDRFEARKKVIRELKVSRLLRKEEKYSTLIGSCYRCGTIIEPALSRQWFVKTLPLAKEAISAVEDKRIRFVPKNWETTYFEWMKNIHDWCISRQIWWGHRIPAWHCKGCSGITVSTVSPKNCASCGSTDIFQDPDVLDTWFSSALWPFSTLGWPDNTKDLKVFYPTAALFTSFDIIFFWVARMIMIGLKFNGAPPFKDVYIHALVRDGAGQKMSKSKGNVIDPVIMMEKYGTDALRFTLAAFAAQGRDIKLDEDRIEGYRNFSNKLWNLARFALLNISEEPAPEPTQADLSAPDKWIITKLSQCIEDTSKAIEGYEFDAAAKKVYNFIWHELCDWYVELIKPDLKGESGQDRKLTAEKILIRVIKDALKLLHPFMPFITEEIYSKLPEAASPIMNAGMPESKERYPCETLTLSTVMEVIRAIRGARMELNIPPSIPLDCVCFSENAAARNALKDGVEYVKKLAHADNITISEQGLRPKNALFSLAKEIEVFIPLKGLLDVESEKKRLLKELEKVKCERDKVENKLQNAAFREKAPEDVVEKEGHKFALLGEKIIKLNKGLERLEGLTD